MSEFKHAITLIGPAGEETVDAVKAEDAPIEEAQEAEAEAEAPAAGEGDDADKS